MQNMTLNVVVKME